MQILAINCGSATIKYKLFRQEGTGLHALARGLVELQTGYAKAIAEVLKHLPVRPDRIVHRVVHGGAEFSQAVWIDAHVRAAIADLAALAPLHNPPALEGIEACAKLNVPMAAVFDTGFHRTLPAVAKAYALPREMAERQQIQRYGFHGISHQYVCEKYAELSGRTRPNLITLHLGNGSSAAAIRGGVCVETSMGLSPLEGLVMGTRGGDMDPGILLHLMRQGHTAYDLERILNHESGLLGLCGTQDMRELLAREDAAAKLAVGVFVHRARKYVGAYLAVLEGSAQAVVFTGGIGEHAAAVRMQICAGLEWAGLELDLARNAAQEPRISVDGAKLEAWVIPTDEELQMAKLAAALPAKL